MNRIFTILLVAFLPTFFVCDIVFGSVQIPMDFFRNFLSGNECNPLWYNIIVNLRLPRAITALLVGFALPISGLLMQTLFRNPLADPYILGVSTGASLGVALFSLAGGITVGFFSAVGESVSVAFSALLGSVLVISIILLIAPKVRDMASLLIIGIMLASITSAVVSVLQYFSNPNEVHSFVLWTMGSLANVDFPELVLMACVIFPMVILTLLIHKSLDAMLLGENYAHSLGVNTSRLKVTLIICSAVLASIVTAFAGPIGFVGMIVPHIARFLFKTNSHKKLIFSSLLIGADLMLICDLISQLPGMQSMLPINTVTAIFGSPIVIAVIYKGRGKSL